MRAPPTVETRVLGAFVLAAAVVMGLALTSLKLERALTDEARRAGLTQEVLVALTEVEAGLRNTESNTRGYVITGDESFLAEREVALSSLESAMLRVKNLLSVDTSQQQHWLRLRSEMDARLELSHRLVLVRASEDFAAAQKLALQGLGREATRRIENLLQVMEAKELQSLAARDIQATRLRKLAVSVSVLAALALITLLTAVYVVIRRQIRAAEVQRAALAEAKTRFESILETAVDGIITIDERGTIITFNSAAARIFGFSPGEAIGRNIAILMPEPYHSEHDKYLRRYREGGTPRIIGIGREVVGRHKDGREFPVRLDVSEMWLEGVRYFNGLVRDITVDKNLLERLRTQSDELERADRMKSEFLANMSHELRTPLNAIIGFSELLKDGLLGPLSARQQEAAGDILISGKHLVALINDILDLSKVEAGRMTLDLAPVDVAELVSASLQVIREKAMVHRVELTLDLAPDLGVAALDALRVKQILYNLLSNAVKFTPEGGSVTVRARRLLAEAVNARHPRDAVADGEYLEIEVADTGIGIAAEEQARLFQPFMQIDSSLARQHMGTGLGLTMIERLANLHGGTVGMESAPGQGSRFRVWLPYHAMADASDAPSSPTDGGA